MWPTRGHIGGRLFNPCPVWCRRCRTGDRKTPVDHPCPQNSRGHKNIYSNLYLPILYSYFTPSMHTERKILCHQHQNDYNSNKRIVLIVLCCSNAMHKVCYSGYAKVNLCLLYTSPSPRDRQKSRMPSSA